MPSPIHFRAAVEHVERHGTDVATLRLRAETRLPRFTPGQFIHLTIDPYDPSGFWPESRAFSVANSVADRSTIQLTISRQGTYTSRILDEVHAGCTVWAKGPYGDFVVGGISAVRKAVLIAGGTGITPFCAFMDAALSAGKLPVQEATLHYGARTPALLIYRDLSDRCAATVPGFSVAYYAERNPDEQGHGIEQGSLDVGRIVDTETVPASACAFYLSGPKAMIRAFETRLATSYDVPAAQILVDAWD